VIFSPKIDLESESVALKIARKYIEKDAVIVTPIFPMITDREELIKHWDKTAGEIKKYLSEGKSVAFLTLGDPLLYSTYIYIMKKVQSDGYETLSTPGITSFCAAVNKIGIPLAEGDESICIISAAYKNDKLREIFAAFDTIVLMKVNKYLDDYIDLLSEMGLINNAYLVSRLGLDNEIIEKDIAKVKGRKINYLSMLIVKKCEKM